MASRAWFVIALFALLATGCVRPEDQETGPTTSSPSATDVPSSTTVPTPSANETGLRPRDFELTDCFGVIARFEWVGPEGPGPTPPEWNDTFGTGGLGAAEIVQLIHCRRIAWGSFERPVTLSLESHNRVDNPEACGEGTFWILNSLWMDDADLVTYLANEYRIPTRLAEFSWQFDNASTPGSQTWAWQVPGGDVSTLTAYTVQGGVQSAELESKARFVWDNGVGVSIMHLNQTATVPEDREQASQGTLKSPTMHAATGVEAWVGTANTLLTDDATGHITEYDDYQCGS